jgi:lysophospholipase L1-like esterase
VNEGIKQLCSRRGFGFVDLFAAVVAPGKDSMRDDLTIDHLHFNQMGYNLMGELVFETIAKHYEKAGASEPEMKCEQLTGKSHC